MTDDEDPDEEGYSCDGMCESCREPVKVKGKFYFSRLVMAMTLGPYTVTAPLIWPGIETTPWMIAGDVIAAVNMASWIPELARITRLGISYAQIRSLTREPGKRRSARRPA